MDHNGGAVNVSPLNSIPMAMENGVLQFPTNNRDSRRHCEEKVDCSAGGVHFTLLTPAPTTVDSVVPISASNFKDFVQKYEKKSHVRQIKDADVNNAVELSIAASETLAIHELMKSGSPSEVLPLGTILEAALQVKQARLEASNDGFCCSSDKIDEIDFLSDLDNSVMVDAFLDIGLSFGGADNQHECSLDISQVKDTPMLENGYGPYNGSKHAQLLAEQDKTSHDSTLSLNASKPLCHVDPILQEPAHAISYVLAATKPRVDVNVSHASISNDSANLKPKNTKSILTFFVGETSFLSESADVAPDENSSAQKHETGSKLVSQSSVHFEGLHDNADEGVLISQDIGSSNPSCLDPLCSVVPCSISLENACSPLSQNQNDNQVNAENCLKHKSDLHIDSFHMTSNQSQNVESNSGDREAMPMFTGERFGITVKRQLASLRTYSTLFPHRDAILEGGQLYNSRQLPSKQVDQEMGWTSSSDQRNSKRLLSWRPIFECNVDRNNKENHDSTVTRNPITRTMTQKRSCEPTKNGPELHVEPSVQRMSPVILNRRKRCHPQASKLFVNNLIMEKYSEQDGEQETIIKLHESKNIQKVRSNWKNPLGTHNLVRKRVHFSDVDVEIQQNKELKKPQCSHINRSTFRANKRSKYSSPWLSDSVAQDVKSCFTGHVKNVKKFIFHGLEFLLTGFSSQKEKEIMGIIQKYGGMVLLDIPAPPSNSRAMISRSNFWQLPIVISSNKLQTTKFLYGCAVNALILKVKWLTDSVAVGSIVPPDKYMILSNQADLKLTRIGKSVYRDDCKCIFDRIGIMLHGKHSFCSKLAIIIKHGGGQVFKTLQRLFQSLDNDKVCEGAIVAEDHSRALLRHLRHCALERKIPMMPASWIAKSLHLGKLLPYKEKEDTALTIKESDFATSLDWSEEI